MDNIGFVGKFLKNVNCTPFTRRIRPSILKRGGRMWPFSFIPGLRDITKKRGI